MQAGPGRVEKMLTAFLKQKFPGLDDVAFYAQMFASMVLQPRNKLITQGKGRLSRARQEDHVRQGVSLFLNGLPG